MTARPGAAGRSRAGAALMLAGLLALAALPAWAGDDSRECPASAVAALAAAAGPGFGDALAPEAAARVVSRACRFWPHDPDRLLAAAAFATDDADPGMRTLQLRVGLLDAAGGQVLAGYSGSLEEDPAFQLAPDGLRLDTARYDLAAGVRAFGVVIADASRGPSCPEARFDDELRLLVPQGGRLQPVLQVYRSVWQQLEGEVCMIQPDDVVVTEQAELVLAMLDAAHAGLRDIRVSARISRLSRDPSGMEDIVQRVEHATLRYDGARYRPVGGDAERFWLWTAED